MNTKRPIIDFFAEHLPEYRFVGERRPNLVFQCRLPSDIFRMIAVQRDSRSNGLAVELAATYNPKWSGEPAIPLGVSAGLANLRLKNMMIEVMEHWNFYEPTPEGLRRTLEEIHRQFEALSPAFFKEAENKLQSSRLLQLALAESRNTASSELAGIQQALVTAKYKLADLEHPAYLRLRSRLQDAWTPEVPKDERRMSNRIACDCLLLASAEQSPQEA
jgi:hypothetical protein